jgi:hypothetical protein
MIKTGLKHVWVVVLEEDLLAKKPLEARAISRSQWFCVE